MKGFTSKACTLEPSPHLFLQSLRSPSTTFRFPHPHILVHESPQLGSSANGPGRGSRQGKTNTTTNHRHHHHHPPTDHLLCQRSQANLLMRNDT